MQPVQIKCMDCKHFRDVEPDYEKMDIYYLCRAYPKRPGIPDDIFAWAKPHRRVREDQVGDYVFEEKK